MAVPRPAPVETRGVVCPHCDRPFDVPAKAISVVCRHCSKRVVVEDMRIDAYYGVVRLATCGRVEVGKRGHVAARVRVNQLVVQGTVHGEVVALERVEVGPKGKLFGDLRTPRLEVAAGGVVVGRLEVGPHAFPPAPAEAGPKKPPGAV